MRVYSPVELEPVSYRPRPDGFADVHLRRDIAWDAEQEQWTAEEQYLETDATEEEVLAGFDAFWAEAVRLSLTDAERLSECEDAQADSTLALAELGLITAEQDEALAAHDELLMVLMEGVAELGCLVGGDE